MPAGDLSGEPGFVAAPRKLGRWGAAQKPPGAQVFIQISPVDAITAAGNLPAVSLPGRRAQDTDGATTMRSTAKLSSVQRTFATRSSAASAKIPMPRLPDLELVLLHQQLYPPQFGRETHERVGTRNHVSSLRRVAARQRERPRGQ
jgi:hypothetical protein